MHARAVSFLLKPGRSTDFASALENAVIPLLRQQKGFLDEIALLAPDGNSAIGISLWDLKEDADVYARRAYPAVLRALEGMVEGTPQVQPYEVTNSTLYRTTAARAIA